MNRKNIMVLFLALVFGLALTSEAASQMKFGPRTEPIFKIFLSGTFHMKATMSSGGMQTDIESFCKNKRVATTMTSSGETMRIIFSDDKSYMINEKEKMIIIIPSQGASIADDFANDKMSYIGSGTASFNGKNLPYEEYRDEDANKVQFFMDGNKFAGTRQTTSEGEIIEMVISVFDQNVPDSAFAVPTSGYKIEDMSNFRF